MNHTFLRLPPMRRLLLFAAGTTLLTVACYVAAYRANVRVGSVPDTFSNSIGPLRRGAVEPIVIVGERDVRYRWGGVYAEQLFGFAHRLDRQIRPGVWTETFVFKPLPAADKRPTN